LSASVGGNWHSQNQPDFGDDTLRIVAADSGAAILNDKFEPITVVAAVSILAEPPYKTASSFLAEPIFADANNGYQLIVHELELCQQLLKTVKADVVHLDLSMRGMNLEELSAVRRPRHSLRRRKSNQRKRQVEAWASNKVSTRILQRQDWVAVFDANRKRGCRIRRMRQRPFGGNPDYGDA
jgi:hypothetical protein